jgi:transmembrane sensor
MGKPEVDINDLLSKYAQNKISELELDMLNRLLKNTMTEGEVKKILDKHWKLLMNDENNSDSVVLKEGFFEQILDKAKKRELITHKKQINWSSWSRIAAIFIGVITISGVLYFMAGTNTNHETNLIALHTDIGERKTVLLPDGSKVTLYAVSELSYPEIFNDTIREIYLKGEAFFEVARNEQQLFVIRTGDLETRVLGTSFNVKAYQDDEQVQVSVATGKVKVNSKATNLLSPSSELILQPDEQAIYGTETGSLSKRKIDSKTLMALRDGILIFEKTELKKVIKTLERWYNTDLELTNPNIANCLISSKLDNAELEDVLETLKYILNVEYEHLEGNKIILKGGSCSPAKNQ